MTAPAVATGAAPARRAERAQGDGPLGRPRRVLLPVPRGRRLRLPVPADRRRRRCSPSTGRTASVTKWGGLSHQVVRDRPRRRGREDRPDEQLHRRDPERDPGHAVRDDGGARAPAGRQEAPARVRRADLHERHRARDRHRPLDPGPLRDRLRLHRDRRSGSSSSFGYPTIIAAHVLFNTSLVLLLVRARLSGMDRSLVDASADLFATPWRTFRQITFPQLLPAIVAGFLLSFTFSFDDYVITTFMSGPGLVDPAAVHLRPGQARRDPGDQRGRHDDAGAHAAPAAHRPVRADLAGPASRPARPRWPRSIAET